MGAWDTGIFDNDSAADFSSSVESCTTMEARHDVLMATMGAVLEKPYAEDDLAGEYEFPYETEHALASAAYVADAKNNRRQFTNNAYAMGCVTYLKAEYIQPNPAAVDEDGYYPIDLGRPSPELVQRALETVEKILAQMGRAGVEELWTAPTRLVLEALQK